MPALSPRTATTALVALAVVAVGSGAVVGSGTLVGASAAAIEPVHGNGPSDATGSCNTSADAFLPLPAPIRSAPMSRPIRTMTTATMIGRLSRDPPPPPEGGPVKTPGGGVTGGGVAGGAAAGGAAAGGTVDGGGMADGRGPDGGPSGPVGGPVGPESLMRPRPPQSPCAAPCGHGFTGVSPPQVVWGRA